MFLGVTLVKYKIPVGPLLGLNHEHESFLSCQNDAPPGRIDCQYGQSRRPELKPSTAVPLKGPPCSNGSAGPPFFSTPQAGFRGFFFCPPPPPFFKGKKPPPDGVPPPPFFPRNAPPKATGKRGGLLSA